MANKYKGEVGFAVDGKSYTMVLNVNALCELESRLDDMQGALTSLMTGGGKGRLTVLRTVFYAALSDYHPDITLRDAGALMTDLGLPVAFAKVSEALMLAFPARDGDGDAGPLAKAGDDLRAAPDGTGTAS